MSEAKANSGFIITKLNRQHRKCNLAIANIIIGKFSISYVECYLPSHIYTNTARDLRLIALIMFLDFDFVKPIIGTFDSFTKRDMAVLVGISFSTR